VPHSPSAVLTKGEEKAKLLGLEPIHVTAKLTVFSGFIFKRRVFVFTFLQHAVWMKQDRAAQLVD
jgi:hypothetical protein